MRFLLIVHVIHVEKFMSCHVELFHVEKFMSCHAELFHVMFMSLTLSKFMSCSQHSCTWHDMNKKCLCSWYMNDALSWIIHLGGHWGSCGLMLYVFCVVMWGHIWTFVESNGDIWRFIRGHLFKNFIHKNVINYKSLIHEY